MIPATLPPACYRGTSPPSAAAPCCANSCSRVRYACCIPPVGVPADVWSSWRLCRLTWAVHQFVRSLNKYSTPSWDNQPLTSGAFFARATRPVTIWPRAATPRRWPQRLFERCAEPVHRIGSLSLESHSLDWRTGINHGFLSSRKVLSPTPHAEPEDLLSG